jgi:hypothetical protein
MDQRFVKQVKYLVLPATAEQVQEEYRPTLIHLRQYWMAFWTELYKKLGSTDVPEFEEFDRQDKITALLLGQNVVGMHLLKGYARGDFETQPYFKPYPSEFFDGLRARSTKSILALQYFMVDQKFSRKATGVNFGAVIAALSLKYQVQESFDVSITIGRRDISVTDTAKKFGFVELAESTTLHNVPVSLLACFSPKPYPENDVNVWADFFWQNRIDLVTGQEIRKAG